MGILYFRLMGLTDNPCCKLGSIFHMALCLSDFKGYFQMVNLKMENVACEYKDFGI